MKTIQKFSGQYNYFTKCYVNCLGNIIYRLVILKDLGRHDRTEAEKLLELLRDRNPR